MINSESTNSNYLGDMFSGSLPPLWMSPPQTRSTSAACYVRFSSDLQSTDSLDQQQRACREAAERHGSTIDDSLVFTDEAVSGTKLVREGLEKMVRAAANGEFDTLYLYSLSRLARETSIAVPLVKTLVHRYGVRVVSVAEGIDTAHPVGRWLSRCCRLSTSSLFVICRGASDGDMKRQSDADNRLGTIRLVIDRYLLLATRCLLAVVTSRFQGLCDRRRDRPVGRKDLPDVCGHALLAVEDRQGVESAGCAEGSSLVDSDLARGDGAKHLGEPEVQRAVGWGRTKTRRDPLTGTTKQ